MTDRLPKSVAAAYLTGGRTDPAQGVIDGWATIVNVTGEHYFTAEPTTKAHRRTVTFTAAGHDFALTAAGGVFSADRLDPGTAVLLRKAQPPAPDEPGPLLDLGCGYGPIACVLATVAPSAQVYAIDVNTRALELAAANAISLGLTNVTPALADDISSSLRFRQIWSNPPIHIGKAELHALLMRWLTRLTPDGVAWLVVSKNLGADSLQEWLIGNGFDATRVASQKGFRILRVAISSAATPA
jgi:16S rRNA G1207 methylase RsmC